MKERFTYFVNLANECFAFYARPVIRFDRWLGSRAPRALLVGILIMALLSAWLVVMAFQFALALRVAFLAVDVACSVSFIVQTIKKWM